MGRTIGGEGISNRGVFDKETSRKPLSFGADAVRMGFQRRSVAESSGGGTLVNCDGGVVMVESIAEQYPTLSKRAGLPRGFQNLSSFKAWEMGDHIAGDLFNQAFPAVR